MLPQMSSLDWFLLMFYFLIIYLFLMIMIYFFYNFYMNTLNYKFNKNIFFMKWY